MFSYGLTVLGDSCEKVISSPKEVSIRRLRTAGVKHSLHHTAGILLCNIISYITVDVLSNSQKLRENGLC